MVTSYCKSLKTLKILGEKFQLKQETCIGLVNFIRRFDQMQQNYNKLYFF
jgi:hypothetical protein